MKWTKEAATKELNTLAIQAEELKAHTRNSSEHIQWLVKTRRFLREVFGDNSEYYETFCSLPWKRKGSFSVGGPAFPGETANPQRGITRVHQEAYMEHLEVAKGLLFAAKEELVSSEIEEVYKGKDTPPEASLLMKIFSTIEYKLRKLIRDTPDNERVIQDALENLLIGADIPYSRESDSIEYSSKTYISDFSIPKADLAIECKFCARSSREKEMIAEINDDILAYKTKYGNILFVIYDIGIIRDIDRFIGNFETQEGVIVKIIKH